MALWWSAVLPKLQSLSKLQGVGGLVRTKIPARTCIPHLFKWCRCWQPRDRSLGCAGAKECFPSSKRAWKSHADSVQMQSLTRRTDCCLWSTGVAYSIGGGGDSFPVGCPFNSLTGKRQNPSLSISLQTTTPLFWTKTLKKKWIKRPLPELSGCFPWKLWRLLQIHKVTERMSLSTDSCHSSMSRVPGCSFPVS